MKGGGEMSKIRRVIISATAHLRAWFIKIKYINILKLGRGVKIYGKVIIWPKKTSIRIGDFSAVYPDFEIIPVGMGGEGLSIDIKTRVRIWNNVLIQGSGHFVIGDNSSIGRGTIVGVNESVEIGKNVLIADYVMIRDMDHIFKRTDIPIQEQGLITAPVKIGDDVWIGHGAVITRGVNIGNGCVIGANAVVTKNIPPYSVAVGVPAKVVKKRLNEQIHL